jgi:LytS/YehU family sensor histidine kinase
VENEVDILRKYMEMEALRFEQEFTYEITASDELLKNNLKIPQMLIQPFMENAIWHGLLMKEGHRTLRIALEKVDDATLSCTIDDNGVGRAHQTSARSSGKKSLGIQFISQRLHLMQTEYGGEYGVQIIDKTGQDGTAAGTCVKVKIPIVKN